MLTYNEQQWKWQLWKTILNVMRKEHMWWEDVGHGARQQLSCEYGGVDEECCWESWVKEKAVVSELWTSLWVLMYKHLEVGEGKMA